MTQITLEEAGPLLARLARAARAGEEVIIMENDRPLVKLVPVDEAPTERPKPQFGSGKGQVLYMAPDFDAPLEDFKEYMA